MAKIAVIGDVMLDKYVYCKNRENPESSAPAYTIVKEEFKPGGAGNVAANLVSLGDEVLLISLIGKDENGGILKKNLESQKIKVFLIEDEKMPTILKERALSAIDGRYHHRLDREEARELNINHVDDLMEKLNGFDVILISDYNKGMISPQLMEKLSKTGKAVIVDPKPAHISYYNGIFLIKPNSKEVKEMTGVMDDAEAGRKLAQKLKTNVLLTRGEHGTVYFGLNGEKYEFPGEAKEVFDVTGAGDSTIAAFAHFYARGFPIRECARLANKAGGISVGHTGCYCVREDELLG